MFNNYINTKMAERGGLNRYTKEVIASTKSQRVAGCTANLLELGVKPGDNKMAAYVLSKCDAGHMTSASNGGSINWTNDIDKPDGMFLQVRGWNRAQGSVNTARSSVRTNNRVLKNMIKEEYKNPGSTANWNLKNQLSRDQFESRNNFERIQDAAGLNASQRRQGYINKDIKLKDGTVLKYDELSGMSDKDIKKVAKKVDKKRYDKKPKVKKESKKQETKKQESKKQVFDYENPEHIKEVLEAVLDTTYKTVINTYITAVATELITNVIGDIPDLISRRISRDLFEIRVGKHLAKAMKNGIEPALESGFIAAVMYTIFNIIGVPVWVLELIDIVLPIYTFIEKMKQAFKTGGELYEIKLKIELAYTIRKLDNIYQMKSALKVEETEYAGVYKIHDNLFVKQTFYDKFIEFDKEMDQVVNIEGSINVFKKLAAFINKFWKDNKEVFSDKIAAQFKEAVINPVNNIGNKIRAIKADLDSNKTGIQQAVNTIKNIVQGFILGLFA